MTSAEKYLLDRYGLNMTTEDLARELKFSGPRAVLDAISRETFPIPTRREGKRRLADSRDVAAYLDKKREEAA